MGGSSDHPKAYLDTTGITGGLFRGQIDGVRIYRYDLAPNDIAVLATRRPIRDILAWPRDRQISSPGYQIPLKLDSASGQNGASHTV